jgi:biopolymer transport protein ExbD
MLTFKKSKYQSGDVEVNLASVIDCFTVLILYLLVSASFVSYGVLDVGVAEISSKSGKGEIQKNPQGVDIQLLASHTIRIKTNSGTEEIASAEGTWDYAQLSRRLDSIKKQNPKTEAVWVSADHTVEYQHVIKTVSVVGRSIASVNLGRATK